MKVSLINPRVNSAIFSIPHGLLQIHAELKRSGHQVDIIDYNKPGMTMPYERLNQYDVVGLSAMSLQLRHAVEIAEELSPNVHVVWGGIHATLDPHSILNRFKHHFLIRGEGEIPLLRLMEYWSAKQSLEWLKTQEGICFWAGKQNLVVSSPFYKTDLGALADLNYYDLTDLELYLHEQNWWFQRDVRSLQIIVARSCHFDCTFCINAVSHRHGDRYRRKPIEKVRRETEKIIDDFNLQFLQPRDEDFFIDWAFVEEWMTYAREKGFLWEANGRYNLFSGKHFTDERLRRLVESGLYCMNMAIEAGDEEVRNRVLNKKVIDKHIYTAVNRIKNLFGKRFGVGTSFMAYFPGDTHKSRNLTVKWMDYLSKNLNIALSGPQIYREYPGSKLYEMHANAPYGDLSYYIEKLHTSGADISLAGSYSGVFYSKMLLNYFNLRFIPYDLIVDQNGHHRVGMKTQKRPGRSGLSGIMIKTIMLPILLRSKLNFWRFFIDPPILGFIYDRLLAMKNMLGNIFSKYSPKTA